MQNYSSVYSPHFFAIKREAFLSRFQLRSVSNVLGGVLFVGPKARFALDFDVDVLPVLLQLLAIARDLSAS